MTTIEVLDNRLRLQFDGRQYHPQLFNAGGNKVKNPRTGEVKIKEPSWENSNKYYTSLSVCLNSCAKQLISNNHDSLTIREYLDELDNIVKRMEAAIND